MSDVMAREQRTVSSIFSNLEKLICQCAPRSGQALLGARWSFVLPPPAATLAEYSFPLGSVPFVNLLAERVGLQIIEHSGRAAAHLYAHLERGEPVVAAVDSFFLPYRPAFGRVHSHRTLLVRRGRARGEVWIEDTWLPGYEGPLRVEDLERARYSPVPLDRHREPVFAGRPVQGEWFSVGLLPRMLPDVPAWAKALLRTLHAEATDSPQGHGIGALRRFCRELEQTFQEAPGERFERVRQASLLLRAELSSRVYLCALLRAAAGWMGEPRLREAAITYYSALRSMEMARDVLIKGLVYPRPEYGAFILGCLASSVDAEERLAVDLARCVALEAHARVFDVQQ